MKHASQYISDGVAIVCRIMFIRVDMNAPCYSNSLYMGLMDVALHCLTTASLWFSVNDLEFHLQLTQPF